MNEISKHEILPEKLKKDVLKVVDPFGIAEDFLKIQSSWLKEPNYLLKNLGEFGTNVWNLGMHLVERVTAEKKEGQETEAIPAKKGERDDRFADPAWNDNVLLELLKKFYLSSSQLLEDAITNTPEVDEKTKKRALFWSKQVVDLLAPSNNLLTNPAAIDKIVQTKGKSLVTGIKNAVQDAIRGQISMVDMDQYKLGENIANTPGFVVYRNEMMELIQYSPTTDKVKKVPILFLPPWINKYYVLDLNPKLSMIRYMVSQGFTVFLISWRNPPKEMRDTKFEEYMNKGVLRAAEVVKEITGSEVVHPVGYCIGGIMLTALMAMLNRNAGDKPNPFEHWSTFTKLTDFEHPGDLEVFITERVVDMLDDIMDKTGYLGNDKFALTFRMLRANGLLWRYFVSNYLFGETPPPIDVLYWNSDSTRVPYATHIFFLREFYLQNKLKEKDGIVIGHIPIDLSIIKQPLYTVSAEQDHIAPWVETFKMHNSLKCPLRYVLSTSGHIMGIINPPSETSKMKYWVSDNSTIRDPQAWILEQKQLPGSWWPDWVNWLNERCGELVPPPSMGNDKYPKLAKAPGTYVFEK